MNMTALTLLYLPYVAVKISGLRKRVLNGEILKYIESLKETKNIAFYGKKKEMSTKLNALSCAVGFLVRVLLRSDNVCLYRSVILFETCVKKKISCGIFIGVDRDGPNLLGHSWVRTGDGCVIGEGKNLGRFIIVFKKEYVAEKICMERLVDQSEQQM